MTGEFAGQVVMITGATGGLGQGVVRQFDQAGASLALIDRHPAEALSLVSDRQRALAVSADVTDRTSVQAAVEQIVARFGRIDALVHTVGGYASGKTTDVDLDIWEHMMNLNARSVFVTAGTVAAYMVRSGRPGAIVVVLARHAFEGQKNHAAYGASKAAAQRVVQSLAKEVLDYGVRVNAVVPGTIDTAANRAAMPNADFSKWVAPATIADAILFLCSERSASISGDSLTVYGRS
jgi:NAD(P)-dependent dehydrogenase (short-subunit alcohol dehydrogenase family)